MASCIYLPSRKLNCSQEMCFERITFSLLLITFEMILYKQLHKEIGQKYSKEEGLYVLGMSAMKVELIGL